MGRWRAPFGGCRAFGGGIGVRWWKGGGGSGRRVKGGFEDGVEKGKIDMGTCATMR